MTHLLQAADKEAVNVVREQWGQISTRRHER